MRPIPSELQQAVENARILAAQRLHNLLPVPDNLKGHISVELKSITHHDQLLPSRYGLPGHYMVVVWIGPFVQEPMASLASEQEPDVRAYRHSIGLQFPDDEPVWEFPDWPDVIAVRIADMYLEAWNKELPPGLHGMA